MSTYEDLMRRMLEVTDRQDWPAREAMLTPECEWVTPVGAARGPAAATAYSVPFAATFPDSRHEVDLIASSGDVIVAEGLWVATHLGDMQTPAGGVPATGRTVRVPFVSVARTAGTLVRSVHIYFDQLGFLAQLGLLPDAQAV